MSPILISLNILTYGSKVRRSVVLAFCFYSTAPKAANLPHGISEAQLDSSIPRVGSYYQ